MCTARMHTIYSTQIWVYSAIGRGSFNRTPCFRIPPSNVFAYNQYCTHATEKGIPFASPVVCSEVTGLRHSDISTAKWSVRSTTGQTLTSTGKLRETIVILYKWPSKSWTIAFKIRLHTSKCCWIAASLLHFLLICLILPKLFLFSRMAPGLPFMQQPIMYYGCAWAC